MDNLLAEIWKVYSQLSCGPLQLKPICNNVLSLFACLKLVGQRAQQSDLSKADKETLRDLRNGCQRALKDLEDLLSVSSMNLAIINDTDIRDKIIEQSSQANAFFELLRSRSQTEILATFDNIQDESEKFEELIAGDWRAIEAALENNGLEKELVHTEIFFIRNWLIKNQPSEVEPGIALPGYAPGTQRETIHEKATDVEVPFNLAVESVATSSKADPPPYSFEDGGDETLDDRFLGCIQNAIHDEASFLSIQQLEDPSNNSYPWSWLPVAWQHQYEGHLSVEKAMKPNSFSIMAYETAPRCLEEIERLRRLMRISFDQKQAEVTGTIGAAFGSLNVMLAAISKFVVLQDRNSRIPKLSDLDIFEYECSTVSAVQPAVIFPETEFDLAQKSCYRLLTYVMGFLRAFSSLFSGMTYITKTPHELDVLWNELMMHSRVAWVEKQLAAWHDVETAISYCRDFYGLRPGLRSQALIVLKDWEASQSVLSGSQNDHIELRVISAISLPKTSFRMPSAWAKVVFYGHNRNGGAIRLFELKTDAVPKSQFPVWDMGFVIEAPPKSKMIQVEIHDRVSGIMDKEIARVILKFTSGPGGEEHFVNRSLIYGFDEEIDFPLQIIGSKGKEKDEPVLKLGLQWAGRLAKVEEMGLPTLAPGKMFRSDSLGIPLLQEVTSHSGSK